jgi:hypothetical protein
MKHSPLRLEPERAAMLDQIAVLLQDKRLTQVAPGRPYCPVHCARSNEPSDGESWAALRRTVTAPRKTS